MTNNYNPLDQFRMPLDQTSNGEELATMAEVFTPTPFHYQINRFGYGGHGVDWTRIPLLWYALPWAIAFSLARYITKKAISGPISRIAGIRGMRAQKFSYQIWIFMFYVVSSVYGWIILHDKDWVAFPLGKEEGLNLFRDSPQIPTDDIMHYYCYEIGFFLAELVAIFAETKRSDFSQYVIHHTVSIYLIFFSWVCYEHRIGTYVLLIHDIGDIFLASAKLMHYLKWEKMLNINFGIFTATFIFLRLVCLPSCTYPLLIYNTQLRAANGNVIVLTVLLAVILQGLHIVWFRFIIMMVIRLLKGEGGKGDVRSDDDEEEDAVADKSDKGNGGGPSSRGEKGGYLDNKEANRSSAIVNKVKAKGE